MDARTTTGQADLQADPDGQLAGLAERFDDHLGWAYRFGMVDNWEVFRCELHAALTLVLRLDGEEVDPEDLAAVARLGQQHRDLDLILEQARTAADPVEDWRGCYDAIWELAGRAGLVEITPGTMTLTATLGVAIGALVRSQVAAITGSLVWMFIVENLAATSHYRIGRWLPFQALNAIFATDEARTQSVIAPLAPELGLTVFLTYVLLATLAAGVLMTERDV
jgi:hypothetical protein